MTHGATPRATATMRQSGDTSGLSSVSTCRAQVRWTSHCQGALDGGQYLTFRQRDILNLSWWVSAVVNNVLCYSHSLSLSLSVSLNKFPSTPSISLILNLLRSISMHLHLSQSVISTHFMNGELSRQSWLTSQLISWMGWKEIY